jgi:ATP-dependent Clp protease protease subunit
MQESVAASRSYDEFGMYSLSGTHEGPASYSMGMGMPSMSMGRAGRGYRRMRSSAPDLPSLLLDSRIIFLGMPVRDQLSIIFLICNIVFIRFQLTDW